MYLKKLISVAAFAAALSATAAIAADRSVALVLDASGSMNGRLADGTAKIRAAKSAVRDLAGRLPGDVRLSLRAYGHQSPRARHDCKDTQLLVPFGAADGVRGNVIGTSDGLTAKGYTPITYVLGLAADDLKPETGEKVLVLVSDGKETCEGDPCLLAKKLAEADADLAVPDGYDALLAFNLLHLLRDLDGAIARAHAMLATGGLYISKSGCIRDMSILVRTIIPALRAIGKAPFVNVFTAAELEARIRAGGFEILESTAFDGARNTRFIAARKV